ncbi:MAG TPA: SRPBCC family protein [Nitrospiraceae bacterium]
MLKIIALILVVLIVAVLLYAATRPDTFRIQRSVSINAPAEKIFPFINDFRKWVDWSPWERMDPELKRSFSGTASGPGSVYEWEGPKVGKGRMEIAKISPPTSILIDLDFLKPFEAHNIAEFTLEPSGSTTTVTWAMYGPSPYIAKVMHIFFSMDKMVGKDFETGLANLKASAER